MAPTSNGAGYYEVASDGGIFTFGNARFLGSAAGLSKALISGMALTAGGAGYWIVSATGGVFTYGNARFLGSMGGTTLANPIVGIAPSSGGGGYWLLPSNAPRWPWGLSPLSYGSSGASVQALQVQLGKLGYWTDGPNGSFDDSTQQAVWALEKAAGIGRAGVTDVPTFSALVQGVVPHPRTTSGYWIEINLTNDLLMFVNNGRLQYTLNTSTGGGYVYQPGNQLAITPQGQFSIFRSVNGLVVDTLGALWRPRYFTGGYAIHGDGSVPPYPVSHGCARVSNEAINWIWANNLAPIGASVWVYS
jgi:peptidoglycan hydrolase-like protein with peptidoglycan-binding domain